MAWDGSKEDTPAGLVEEAAAASSETWTVKEAHGGNLVEAELGEDPIGCPTAGDLMGRQRLSAVVSRLEQEIQSLQAELEEVDTRLRPSSAACEELVSGVERTRDGLLPVTPGPGDVAWDRWFHCVHGDKGESSRSSGAGGRRWWTQGLRFLSSSSGQVHVDPLSK